MVDGLDRLGHHTVVGGHDQHHDVGGTRAPGPHGRERLVTGSVDEGERPVIALDLIGTDVLGDPARLAVDHVRVADPVEQQRLAVVDVAHDGDHGSPEGRDACVIIAVDPEELAQFGLLLLTRVDEADLSTDLGREKLHHLVTQRLGGGDHLTVLHQEADHIGGGAIELGAEVLGGRGPLHHDDALGHRGVTGRVGGDVHGLEFLAHPPAAALAARWASLGATGGAPAPARTARRSWSDRPGTALENEDRLWGHLGGGLPVDQPAAGVPPGGKPRWTGGAPAQPDALGLEPPEGRAAGRGEAEEAGEWACPTARREGVPDLRGRGGAALACALGPAGLGGGGSSATGGGSWMTGRLAGATLPLEEMVTFGLAAAGSVTSVAAGAATAAIASGSTCGAAWVAGALAAGAARTLDSLLISAAGFSATADWGLGASTSRLRDNRRLGLGASRAPVSGAPARRAPGSATFTGSGGGGGFSSPSRSARRRTRSA